MVLLKWLVIGLTATMMAGMAVLVFLFATRFPAAEPDLALPESIPMPPGARAAAFTHGRDWIAIVTEDDEILIFSPDAQELRQRIVIE